MFRRRWLLSAALVTLLAVPGCAREIQGVAVSGSGQPAGPVAPSGPGRPAQQPGGLPFDSPELVEAFKTMRSWDVCAMHDPDALRGNAESMSVTPNLDLSDCRLELETGDGATVEYTIALEEPSSQAGASETVGGAQVEQVPDSTGSGCAYQYRFQQVAAITLAVKTFDSAMAGQQCAMAKDYLSAIMPNWQDPPQWTEGRTTPRFRMAGVDPCQGLLPVYQQFRTHGIQVSAWMDSPYHCEINTPDDQGYSVTFAMTVQLDEEGEQVQLGGLRGSAYSGSVCDVQLDLGDGRIPSESGIGSFPIIDVLAASCDAKNKATIEQIVRSYAKPLAAKLPAPRAGALRLSAG